MPKQLTTLPGDSMNKRRAKRDERPPDDPVEAAFRVIELVNEEPPPAQERQVFTLQVPEEPAPEQADYPVCGERGHDG